jgi:chaperonin GroEL
LKAREALKKLEVDTTDPDEKVGIKIVYDALKQPLRWLVKNAGLDPDYVQLQIEASKEEDYGFDIATLKFGSMKNIIDPAKVVKSAVLNAVSVAINVLTVDVSISEKKNEPIK